MILRLYHIGSDSIAALSSEATNELEKLLNHEMANPNLRGLKFSDIYFTR